MVYLETKPDYETCIERIEAWFHGSVIDRAPVRFHRHNAEYDSVLTNSGHATLEQRWMDAEFQARTLTEREGTTFPRRNIPGLYAEFGPQFLCRGTWS